MRKTDNERSFDRDLGTYTRSSFRIFRLIAFAAFLVPIAIEIILFPSSPALNPTDQTADFSWPKPVMGATAYLTPKMYSSSSSA